MRVPRVCASSSVREPCWLIPPPAVKILLYSPSPSPLPPSASRPPVLSARLLGSRRGFPPPSSSSSGPSLFLVMFQCPKSGKIEPRGKEGPRRLVRQVRGGGGRWRRGNGKSRSVTWIWRRLPRAPLLFRQSVSPFRSPRAVPSALHRASGNHGFIWFSDGRRARSGRAQSYPAAAARALSPAKWPTRGPLNDPQIDPLSGPRRAGPPTPRKRQ